MPNPTHRGQHSDDRGQSGEGLKSGPDRHPNQLIPPPQPRAGMDRMPGTKVAMRKVREVLRLKHALGMSERLIADAVGVGKTAVGEYLRRARVALMAVTQSRIAAFNSASEKKRRWRSFAS